VTHRLQRATRPPRAATAGGSQQTSRTGSPSVILLDPVLACTCRTATAPPRIALARLSAENCGGHLAEASGTVKEGSRGLRRDSERGRVCQGRRARDEGGLRTLGGRAPVQRPRLLPGGGVGRPASHLGHRLPVPVNGWAARPCRGGRARRRRRARTRGAGAAGGVRPPAARSDARRRWLAATRLRR